jgi:L-fuconolactonase
MMIDAHHHFWRYDPREYDWISPVMSKIRRDFLPDDLDRVARDSGIDGVITVQARQTLEETGWLLELARSHEWVKGVVGWVPLVDPDVRVQIQEHSRSPKLRGVRHVLQGEPDEYLSRDDFNAGVAALREFGLRYDILILERQLPATIKFVDRHPEQIFILDHVAKPKMKARELSPWRENIRELARRPRVYCKLSGMLTEADWSHWSVDDLRPYVHVVLDAFGPERLMFGSDWPVCLVASEYGRWVQTVEELTGALSDEERSRIFGGTARDAYRLE